ncbi:hypothetical protein F2982_15475 [Rhizobium sp. BG4]|nr:hypothetical protein F2982_15475 [Rhizobium sp. BG4]
MMRLHGAGRCAWPPHPPFGHLLPAGEKGERDGAAHPFSPRGEGARRADEGAVCADAHDVHHATPSNRLSSTGVPTVSR